MSVSHRHSQCGRNDGARWMQHTNTVLNNPTRSSKYRLIRGGITTLPIPIPSRASIMNPIRPATSDMAERRGTMTVAAAAHKAKRSKPIFATQRGSVIPLTRTWPSEASRTGTDDRAVEADVL